MKQLFSKLTKGVMLASIAVITAVSFTGCTKDDDTSVSAGVSFSLNGSATSSQAVPASSNSNGSGTFSGAYNSSTKVMTYTTTWTNLTSAPLSGGLYTGATGVVGSSLTIWSLGSGLSTSGSFSSSTTLNADQEAQLLSGNSYYLFSTAANASGEVRGQITATQQ